MECRSGNNPRLKYFVKLLAAQDSDTAQQDERRRRRLKGVHGSRCRHDLKCQRLEQWSRAAPARFGLWQPCWGSSTGVNLCQRLEHFLWWGHVSLDLDWDTQGHQAAPVQLPCPLRHVSLALCLTLWCTSNQGSVFYNSLQSCHVPLFS